MVKNRNVEEKDTVGKFLWYMKIFKSKLQF